MVIEIRAIEPEDAETFLRAMSGPFFFDLPTEETKLRERLERFGRIFDAQRARCAFDGPKMVGTLGAFSLAMTVPGGSVPCAGTTMVTVQATHRRRGVLTRMITSHLEDVIERGEPIAGLWASDSAIYGRYGYGMATQEMQIQIPRHHAGLHRGVALAAPVEMVNADEARRLLPGIYAKVLSERPGMFARSDVWWERRLRDDPDTRDGATAYRFAVAGEKQRSGYAIFRVRSNWEDGHGAGELRIEELMAVDPGAEVALWSLLASTDLIGRIVANHRPADDAILSLLASPRRAKAEMSDALWIRIVDVPRALSARSYSVDGTLTMEVADPMGLSSGRFRLEHIDRQVHCDRTAAEPDLTLDIEELSACYLGWSRFRTFERAGRVKGDPGALTTADLMFGWDPAPWCPDVF